MLNNDIENFISKFFFKKQELRDFYFTEQFNAGLNSLIEKLLKSKKSAVLFEKELELKIVDAIFEVNRHLIFFNKTTNHKSYSLILRNIHFTKTYHNREKIYSIKRVNYND